MNTQSDLRQRGSRDRWLEAAYELLISDGIDAVKVMSLAQRLNLTRTGFYWFFENISEMHDAMIERWEGKNTGNLVASCSAEAETITQALFNIMDCWLEPALFDARLDLAIRNWARVSPELQKRMDDADMARVSAVTEMFLRFGYDAEAAKVRGMTVIYTQIGYLSMDVREDRKERLNRVQHYVELFAGQPPRPAEVQAFLLRHS